MRARLHVRNGRIGFFREGTHSLCDAAPTRQLRDDTIEVIRRLESSLGREPRQQVGDIEIAENIDASAARRPFRAPAGRRCVPAGRRRASRRRDRRILRASGECADDGAVWIDDGRATRSSAPSWIVMFDPFSRAIDICWRRLSNGSCRTSARDRSSISMPASACSASRRRPRAPARLPPSKAICSRRAI